eukprot:1192352-Pyramimonas_sp.AAC.2
MSHLRGAAERPAAQRAERLQRRHRALPARQRHPAGATWCHLAGVHRQRGAAVHDEEVQRVLRGRGATSTLGLDADVRPLLSHSATGEFDF